MRPDQAAKGDDDAEIGAGVEHRVDVARHRQAQLERSLLHRAGRGLAPPAPPLVGAGDHEPHVEAGGHQARSGDTDSSGVPRKARRVGWTGGGATRPIGRRQGRLRPPAVSRGRGCASPR